MADKFKFSLLTGTNPQAQYDAIQTKDDLTFYLLNNGVGYLGNTPLFGGGTQQTVVKLGGTVTEQELERDKLYVLDGVEYNGIIRTGLYFFDGEFLESFSDELMANYLTNIIATEAIMADDNFTGADDQIASTKGVMTLIDNLLSDSSIVNAAFFRSVKSHTLTAEDLLDETISKPEGAQEGDVGLLFTADTDNVDGGESYYFVSLKNYVTVYNASNTNSINMSLDTDSNTFSAELNVAATETSITVDENGISLIKTDVINDGDGTPEGGTAPSQDRLVTEAALVNYVQDSVLTAVNEAITEALADVVTYTIDDGTTA